MSAVVVVVIDRSQNVAADKNKKIAALTSARVRPSNFGSHETVEKFIFLFYFYDSMNSLVQGLNNFGRRPLY